MTTLEFIASLAESLGLPLAAFLIALVFRKPISQILKAIRKMRFGDLEFDFGDELRHIQDVASRARIGDVSVISLSSIGAESSQEYETVENEVESVAEVSPLAAIPLAWSYVEREIGNAVSRLGLSKDKQPNLSVIKNIRLLHDEGYLDEDAVQVLNRMR